MRCRRLGRRCFRIALCVGSVARRWLVLRSVLLLLLQVSAIARLVRRSFYLLLVCRIGVVCARFAWRVAGVRGACLCRKRYQYLRLASVVGILLAPCFHAIHIYVRRVCSFLLLPSQYNLVAVL